MTTLARRGPAGSAPLEIAGRAGLAARGVVYLVVAALAVGVARHGASAPNADTTGALAAVGSRPYGQALLWLLAAGLAGYAAWHAAQVVTGRTSTSEDASAAARAASAVRGLLYLGLAAAAVHAAVQGASGSGAEQQASWTATVLGWPGGRVLIAVAGIALVLVGAAQVVTGITGRFMQGLREGQLGDVSHRAVRVAGGVGHLGRGAAFALVGAFVVQAALQHDPSKSRGLDGALAELAGRSFGPAALIAIALGLAAFGLYSIAEARWRRVRA